MADDSKTLAEAQAQLRYLQNVYSQQYELLENEIATFSLGMSSVQRNLDILDNKGTFANSNILINAEGGAYIEGSIKEIKKVIVYAGAGYLVEKNVEDAKEMMKETQKKQEETIKKLVGERQKLQNELMDISYKLSALEQGAKL